MMESAEPLAVFVTCHWCGTRMWPAEQLEAHILRHELRRLVYLGELADVQRRFRYMRFPGDKREKRIREAA